uniref:Uncharacterized protein n=1 Tax=Periophthalmus magnuspinnatus TaxID=409849 RepID=A0A3B3ZY63_9GOBI
MALPAPLKAVQHHLRTAQEHEKRDPVVAYYCRLYAMQTGMKLDSKTPECRQFLVKLMDQLETMKKELKNEESITQEVVGNAHIENYALKMFLYADNEDRQRKPFKSLILTPSCRINGYVMKAFPPFSSLLYQNIQHRKYARWKATYIHNCLKNGETPQSGPIGMEDDEEAGPGPSFYGSFRGPPPSGPPSGPPSINYNNIHVPPGAHAPANTPAELPPPSEPPKPVPTPRTLPAVDPGLLNAQPQGGVSLSAEDFTRAQKYCKYAGSALQYEDVSTAIQNLQKALKLLTTGKE